MADSNILPLSSDQQQPQTGVPESEEQSTDVAVLGLDAISREMQRLAPGSEAAHEAEGLAAEHPVTGDEELAAHHGEPEPHAAFATAEPSDDADHLADAPRFEDTHATMPLSGEIWRPADVLAQNEPLTDVAETETDAHAAAVDLEPVKQAMMGLSPRHDPAPPPEPVSFSRAMEDEIAAAASAEPVRLRTTLAPVTLEAPVIPLPLPTRDEVPLAPADEKPVTDEQPKPAAAPPPPSAAEIGVLLVNLGTPEAADAKAIRRYLREFLSDKRVIERDSAWWRFVLNVFILPFRPRSRAKAYRKIWNQERNESPLKTITRAQAENLHTMLSGVDDRIAVDWAMRYGQPSIPSRMAALAARGCTRILLMPLYPQYSAATTATACDVVFAALVRMRKQPAIRVLPPYYADPVYIETLARSINAHMRSLTFEPDVILASYHGMPREYVTKGDPYEEHCIETTRLLRERLGLDEEKLVMAYQSRFGRGKWLQPFTAKTVKRLAKSGVKNLAVITPGFAADCLETLEEIAIENAAIFKRHGGKNFVAIPCLNDSEPGMTVLMQNALRELKGWVS